jgi:hypothetical protein
MFSRNNLTVKERKELMRLRDKMFETKDALEQEQERYHVLLTKLFGG